MKILYIKLKNFIGIFNGRGDNLLEIDISKSTTPIIIIKGNNGSGKSTLLKALSPMPDQNNQFIQGMDASKTIVYQIASDIIRIEYLYPIKKDGSRATTKAQIFKNNEPLNLTNNVSDAKEIIYTLFKLDSSFLALSQLSSSDRGLADKRPSERKLFVNSAVSGIEEYNNMYKIINKKFSMYKNIINSLISKINKIGNKEELDASFSNINNLLNNIIKERDLALTNIAKIQSKLDENNDKDFLNRYKLLEEGILEKNKKIKDLSEKLTNISQDFNINNLNNLYSIEKDSNIKISILKENIKNLQSKKINIKKEINELNSELQKKLVEKNSYMSTNLLNEEIEEYNNSLKELNKVDTDIKNINLKIDNKIDIKNLNKLFDYIIDSFRFITDGLNNIDYEMGYDFLLKNKSNENIYEMIQNIKNKINFLNNKINENNIIYSRLEVLLEKTKSLKLRPKNCNNDTCIFIKDALEAFKKDPAKKISTLEKENDELNNKLKNYSKELNIMEDCILLKNKFDSIYNKILSYEFLLTKINLQDFLSYEKLIYIARINNFSKIKEAKKNINTLYNLLELKEKYEKTISLYKSSIDEYNKNKSIIDILNKDIKDYKIKLSEKEKDDIFNENELNNLICEFNELEPFVKKINSFIEHDLHELEKNLNELNNFKKEKEDIKCKVNKIEEINKELKVSLNIVEQINYKYNEVLKRRDILAYNKIMIEKYLEELAEYKNKYEKLETIRYHVSPTTGIQTVFIGAYMNNIIIKANELLSLIFNGQYVIQPFIINESEFRIPCLGSGILNDDISSMSTSQICMISMIISFAMLANADTDYNILKLDEIDGGLDPDNRSQFIGLLNSLISIVNCEQCFLISHNMEYSDKVNIIDMSTRPVQIS